MPLTRRSKSCFFAVLILALVFCAVPQPASAGVAISITIAPPVLPVYTQPLCPVEGYIWVPGYWAWSDAGYYWVPGVWVAPPRVGFLWTPGYWGFVGANYMWHPGYWGPHIGFYGGVNYGYGYFGAGYVGGFWAGSVFRYNTAVTAVNTTIVRNVYVDRTVIHNTYVVNRVSYNGPGGVMARPSMQEQMAMREQHVPAVGMQVSHERNASLDRAQFASVNHGQPGTTAMESVNGRRFNQQGRIAQGIRSGQLTPGETAHLETREATVNREIHADRQANGGRLTPEERQHVEHQQNNMSRAIYKDKHNEREAPGEKHPEKR
ncbi:MAG: YXWGXW repeat-containing protein [Acidobacteriaceae bacterium]|nr:YXWGXW repeat-containing protein [Acidobacteriaceae bacterium]